MNKFLEKHWRKKTDKFFIIDRESIAKYNYAQNALFIWAAESQDNNILAKAAQAVYHWPSFARLMGIKFKANIEDRSVPSVDKIQLNKKTKRSKPKPKKIKSQKSTPKANSKKQAKSVKGESISDDFQNMEPAIAKIGKTSKSKARSTKSKSKALVAKASKNLASQLKNIPAKRIKKSSAKKKVVRKNKTLVVKPTAQNWKAWSRAKSKNENLCNFTLWLNKKNSQHSDAKNTSKIAPKKTIDKSILKSKIKKSIKFNSQVISTPLAELLAKQGHTKEAIKMYQKLSLIFPEKSSFFAAEISTLKKK